MEPDKVETRSRAGSKDEESSPLPAKSENSDAGEEPKAPEDPRSEASDEAKKDVDAKDEPKRAEVREKPEERDEKEEKRVAEERENEEDDRVAEERDEEEEDSAADVRDEPESAAPDEDRVRAERREDREERESKTTPERTEREPADEPKSSANQTKAADVREPEKQPETATSAKTRRLRRHGRPLDLRDELRDTDESAETTARAKTLRAVVLALLLVAATIAAYQQAWRAGFIWDDDMYVTSNHLLTAPDGLKKIWFSLESPSQYFPLVYTSFRFEHALWGLNPAGYHWVNIILHAANALLLWRLLVLLQIPGAWLAAGLFALHPVQVESVAWISERKNVLMGFFYLLSLIAWVKFVAGERKGEIKFYLLALFCFLLALFSKTTACTLPIALLLISWLKRGSVTLQRFLQVVPFFLLGLVMGLVSMWWERYLQGTQGEAFSLGMIERVLVAARAFWFYLAKLAWPAELAFSYPRWPISAADPLAYLWAGACLLLILVLWLLRRWIGRGPEVALVFFAVTLAPTLGFIMLYTFRYTFVADHYQYIACIGPLTLVAAALGAGVDRLGRARIVLTPLLAAALLIPLGWRTWQYAGAYKDQETLWRATIAVNPSSWLARNNLAILLLNSNRLAEAVAEFQEAIRLDPSYAEAHYNLGNAFLRQGRGADARAHYEKAIELTPANMMARTNLSLILLESGQVEPAVAQLQEAVKLEPRALLPRTRLGEALLGLGRTEEAIEHFKAIVEIDPNHLDANRQLARYYIEQRRYTEAREHARRVATADPNDTAAHISLGIIAGEMGYPEEAMAHFQKVLELQPENAEAHYNIGFAYLQKRDPEEAVKHFQRAVEIRPEYAAAHMNLGNIYAETNRLNEAVAAYEKALEIRPGYAAAHRNLATVLNRLGRFDEAMEHLRTAWRLDERRPGGP